MEVRSREEIIKAMFAGIIGWYDFDRERKLLYIGASDDPIAFYFAESGFVFDTAAPHEISQEWSERHIGEYGTIVMISCLETAADPVNILRHLYKVLGDAGHMLLGMNNRMGVRFFCGDIDPYTGRGFDGIEGYVSDADAGGGGKALRYGGRCYSRSEIGEMLSDSGWTKRKFYSVFPGLRDASFIFAENYLPNEDLSGRIFPSYYDPASVLMQERMLYREMISEGLFHGMANAYLIECAKGGEYSNALQVTASLDRGRENAFYTVIREDKTVEKRPAYPEGAVKLELMRKNDEDLKAHGISVADSRIDKGMYVMPYIEAEQAHAYLKGMLFKDKERFLKEMDRFRDVVLGSSGIRKLDDGTEVFERGYFDLVPLNCFYEGGRFVFFDQEFCVKYLPVKVMALRQIASLYYGDPRMDKEYPKELLYKRYGLDEELPRWQKIEWDYLNRLLNNEILQTYHMRNRTDPERIEKRRSSTDRRFMNMLDNIANKKVFLFGSGRYADRFLDRFEGEFPIHGMVDNDPEKQGTKKRGISIISPEALASAYDETFKIIICMKDYTSAAVQLRESGISEYSIYDPVRYRATRARKSMGTDMGPEGDKSEKPYHIGYCAGAFDMFHIGHLNLLRRAKEQCDYLIVGVMSDEKMYDLKKKNPVIPLEERMQVVAGCRYVDQVEELTINCAGIMDSYHMFHYDCMFSGDDHAEEPGWLAERERLRECGSDIIFVPYTKETSSSAIRDKMKGDAGE